MPTTADLKKVCQEIFYKLKAKPDKFNFSYSPEESWKVDTKLLILTLNPQAKNSNGEDPELPDKPWPDEHDFFRDGNDFCIRKPVRQLLAVLAKKDATVPLPEGLQDFANKKVVLASYIPWRTRSAKDLTKEMHLFARDEYWGRILHVWLPEVIIVFGPGPFDGIRKILLLVASQKGKILEKRPSDYMPEMKKYKRQSIYRMCEFIAQNGKKIKLLGIPHPKAHNKTGWPEKTIPASQAPVFQFVNEKLKDFNF